MFPVFNNFSETSCMKVGLCVRTSLVRALSTGAKLPSKRLIPPPPPKKKVFPEKKIKSYSKY